MKCIGIVCNYPGGASSRLRPGALIHTLTTRLLACLLRHPTFKQHSIKLGLRLYRRRSDTPDTCTLRPARMPHCVNFITGNANKLREVKAILEPGIEVRSQSIDLEEVQGTIEEVSEFKCRKAADLVSPINLVVTLCGGTSVLTRASRSTVPSLSRTPHCASTLSAVCRGHTCTSIASPNLRSRWLTEVCVPESGS